MYEKSKEKQIIKSKEWVFLEELRQYIYCPRIPIFRRVYHFQPRETYKMEKGKEYHRKKSLRAYQSKKGEIKYFYEQYLSDKEVKLAGILDAIKICGKKANPIEFKQKYPENEQIPYHHLIQLTAQAILIELSTDFEVGEVEIKYQNNKRLKEKITEETKKETVMIIEELRWNIEKEHLPEPTIHEKKCVDCEYRRVCFEV